MPSEKLLDLRSDGHQPRTVTDQLVERRHGARILRRVEHYWRIFATCVSRPTTSAKSLIYGSPSSGIAVALLQGGTMGLTAPRTHLGEDSR